MDHLQIFFRFIRHCLISRSKFSIHSPFVYNLLVNVLHLSIPNDALYDIKRIRRKLQKDKRVLEIADFGAGSLSNRSNTRTVKEIAYNSVSTTKYLKLYYRLVHAYKPKTIVELGTSLGLSSATMALANQECKVYTLEGCPNIANVAKENFKQLQLNNIELLIGEFDKSIPDLLRNIKKVDLIFFDGNHQKDATLKYFSLFLPYKTNESIFIFDDIHWSDEMEEAWRIIKSHPDVKVTVDLFFLGLVFFRKELSQEHFIYRF